MKSYVNRVPAPTPMIVKDIGLKLDPVEFKLIKFAVGTVKNWKTSVEEALGPEAVTRLRGLYDDLTKIEAE